MIKRYYEFVFEEFERGIDPKKSMGIGHQEAIWNDIRSAFDTDPKNIYNKGEYTNDIDVLDYVLHNGIPLWYKTMLDDEDFYHDDDNKSRISSHIWSIFALNWPDNGGLGKRKIKWAKEKVRITLDSGYYPPKRWLNLLEFSRNNKMKSDIISILKDYGIMNNKD